MKYIKMRIFMIMATIFIIVLQGCVTSNIWSRGTNSRLCYSILSGIDKDHENYIISYYEIESWPFEMKAYNYAISKNNINQSIMFYAGKCRDRKSIMADVKPDDLKVIKSGIIDDVNRDVARSLLLNKKILLVNHAESNIYSKDSTPNRDMDGITIIPYWNGGEVADYPLVWEQGSEAKYNVLIVPSSIRKPSIRRIEDGLVALSITPLGIVGDVFVTPLGIIGYLYYAMGRHNF